MQRLQHGKHTLDVALTKVKTRRLFKALVPHLVPQDGHSDELLTHLDEKTNKGQTVLKPVSLLVMITVIND